MSPSAVSTYVEDVAIIGAGLGGVALAIALHQKSIPCRVYEQRSENAPAVESGVILHVNGLKPLEKLGILQRIADQCYKTQQWHFVNDKDETVKVTETGSEETHGYANHRLYRSALLREMKAMCKELEIPIIYDSKFDAVVNETSSKVEFTINGKTESATLLVGADGIYSKVRSYLTPVVPEYTGITCVFAHIYTKKVQWPRDDFPLTCTVQGKAGSLFMIPELEDCSEMMIGTQFKYPDRTRAEWDAMAKDIDGLLHFFTRDYDDWHQTGKSIIDAIVANKETCAVWPFSLMPPVDSWASESGRVVVIGDAIHAMPASSGQGVNQAIEDAYTLALLLGSATPTKTDIKELLKFWRDWRQKRLDDILLNMAVIDASRLPSAEREKMEKEGKFKHLPSTPEQMKDLTKRIYLPNTEEDMAAWIKEHS